MAGKWSGGKGSTPRPMSEQGKLNWERFWKEKEEQRLKESESREELYEELMGEQDAYEAKRNDKRGSKETTDGSGTS